MKKFFNIKTEEIKEFTVGKDIYYSPYLKTLTNNDGKLMGYSHQDAWFDNDGNEYRPYYGKLLIGSLSALKVDYTNTPSSWKKI